MPNKWSNINCLQLTTEQSEEKLQKLRTIQQALEEASREALVVPELKKPKKRKRDIRTIRRKWREHWHKRTDASKLNRSGIRDHFHKLRNEILVRAKRQLATSTANNEWLVSLDEWVNMWLSCPAVETGFNVKVPAWRARGRDSRKDVQLRRADPKKAYEINNLEIWKGKERLWPEIKSEED